MKYNFNVIHDPWIPIYSDSEGYQVVGVRELFQKAEKVSFINEPNIFYLHGIYNLLTVLYICAFYPKTKEDKLEQLRKGFFDINVFDKYVDNCEKKRPGCFNLFGENPFYQNIYARYNLSPTSTVTKETVSSVKNREEVMIGKIAIEIPSGNNTKFYANDLVIDKKLDFAETVKALLSYSFFQNGQDGPNSANGPFGGQNFPMYIWIKGKTLLDFIVFNSISEEEWNSFNPNLGYNTNPAWELEPMMIPKQVTKIMSLAEGLTFQNRAVLLCEPDSKGLINRIYFTAGRVFENSVENGYSWKCPYVSYYTYREKDKKGEIKSESVIMSKLTSIKEVWMEYGHLFDNSSNIATFKEFLLMMDDGDLEEYLQEKGYSIFDIPYFCICVYIKEGKKRIKQGIFESNIPIGVLEKEIYSNKFASVIDKLTTISFYLKSDLIGQNDSLERNKISAPILSMRTVYSQEVVNQILPKYIMELSNIDYADFDKAIEQMDKVGLECLLGAKKVALKVFEDTCLSFRDTTLRDRNSRTPEGKQKMGFYGSLVSEVRKLNYSIKKLIGEEENTNEV